MEPMTTPSLTLDTSRQPACLRIAGDWTLAHYASLKRDSERPGTSMCQNIFCRVCTGMS